MNNEYVYAEKQVGPYTVKVVQDIDPSNPRSEWDNLATMACFHKRYNLGDKHNLSIEEVKEISESDKYFSLPLYLYDHSGITISTESFSNPWDSGQVGIIFVSKEKVRKEWNVKTISAKLKKQVYKLLESEVKTYDQYLTGEVYGFIVEDSEGEHVDSCFGFYGEAEYCLSEGVSVAEHQIKYDISEHLKVLRQYIKNRVPLMYRVPCTVSD